MPGTETSESSSEEDLPDLLRGATDGRVEFTGISSLAGKSMGSSKEEGLGLDKIEFGVKPMVI